MRAMMLLAAALVAIGIVACGDDGEDGLEVPTVTTTATVTTTPTEAMTPTEAATVDGDDADLRERLDELIPDLEGAFSIDRDTATGTTVIETELSSDEADVAQSICDQVIATGLFPDERIVVTGSGGVEIAECGS